MVHDFNLPYVFSFASPLGCSIFPSPSSSGEAGGGRVWGVRCGARVCGSCGHSKCPSVCTTIINNEGALKKGGVYPLGFSPALLRGGDDRLGRSLDPTLLYYQSYHSWTIVSVTAVTFTARSVHSRAADPDTLHFQGPAAARARSRWRSASCQLWLARHRAY